MAKKKEFIYRVNEDKKIVYIDESIAATDADKIAYTAYINRGFKTHKKSAAKVAQGKRMAAQKKESKLQQVAAA